MPSIVDTSVKHFYSPMAGAPTIGGTAGSLISALDACLVTGFGAKAVDSATVSNGICRLSFASGASAARQEVVILVAGASPAGLNGEQKVTAVASDWVEFRTDVPDGPVTGSISFKLAPLGWEKVFSKTNVAVYRSADPASTRAYLRVDDTNALYARVQLYESMTDVDTGLGVTPSFAGGWYWHKRSAVGSPSYWLVIGDSRGFHLDITTSGGDASTQNGYNAPGRYAGDLNSYRSGDAWSAALVGSNAISATTAYGCIFSGAAISGYSLMRASTGIGGTIDCSRLVFGSNTATSGLDTTAGTFPSRTDNGLRLSPILLTDGAVSGGPRGEIPGAYHCPQSYVGSEIGSDVILHQGVGQFSGKTLLSIAVGPAGNAGSSSGRGFFDITGPWR